MLQKFSNIVKSVTPGDIKDHQNKLTIYRLFRESLNHLNLGHLNQLVEVKSFKEGVLTITSTEGIWVQEVYLRQNPIKKAINQRLTGNKVKYIKVAVVAR